MKHDKKYRILSFWSLNGALTDSEIINQIEDMHEKNYGGFFLHARAGLETEYLSSEWFKICKTAIKTAERLDMEAWLYDENGWPSGFAGGLVPALGDEFTAKHLFFTKALPLNQKIVLAAYKKSGSGYSRLSDKDIESGELFCCLGYLKGYADLLNPKAVKAFIDFTHEKYKQEFGEYFGKTVKGIFTDEPQLVGKFPFTFDYPEEFQKAYGYDFFSQAWKLYDDSLESRLFKYHTSKLFARMFKENFTRQINDWCNKNNLIFTGHFSNEDGLCNQVRSNYNLMSHYDNMERPGIDFLGRRLTSAVLTKQVSDAAFISGKEVITSESFGCCGWDVTFNDLMWIAGYQAAFGINSIVTHLSAYSMKGRRKRDYPAFFSYQEPWWNIFGKLSEKICEINTFVSDGKRNSQIAVIHPVTGMWCLNGGAELISQESKHISNQFRLLVEYLIDIQKDFLLLSEENFARFENDNNILRFGDIEISEVLIPETVSLESSTLEILKVFSQKGGRVTFINRYPALCEGEECDGYRELNAEIICNRRGLLEKYFLNVGYKEEAVFTDLNFGHLLSGLITSVRQYDEELRIFAMNPSKNDLITGYLKVKGEKQIYKNISGKNEILDAFYDGIFTYAKITAFPNECLMFTAIDGKPIKGESSGFSIKKLHDFKVALTDRNVLTIDRCDVYLNGNLLYKDCDPVKVTDDLYKAAYESGEVSQIKLIYKFYADFKSGLPKNISVAAECDSGDITVNGVPATSNGEWFIDKAIKVFNLKNVVHNGENSVEIDFTIERPDELSETGDFEGYKNIFFYNVEPESIYITGDFSVIPKGEILDYPEGYITKEEFYITDSADLNYSEFTKQGLWFYRGKIELYTEFDSFGKEQYLTFENPEFTAAEIFINGKNAGIVFSAPFRINITSFVEKGKNTLNILLYGSNRNTLGPHHHIARNPHMVGVSSFKGEKGFTDFIYPQITEDSTYSHDYSFVRLFTGNVLFEEKE